MNLFEYGPDGTTLLSATIDNGDGTGTYTEYDNTGAVVSVTPLTGLEIHVTPPLDPHGQLVTLLVVVGALDLDDAEHVAGPGITADDLIHEAEAWSIG